MMFRIAKHEITRSRNRAGLPPYTEEGYGIFREGETEPFVFEIDKHDLYQSMKQLNERKPEP